MVVMFAHLVAKTYIIIVYDLLYPPRSKQTHCFPSTVEGSIGYTCSLANQTDRPHSQTPNNMQLTNLGLNDEL